MQEYASVCLNLVLICHFLQAEVVSLQASKCIFAAGTLPRRRSLRATALFSRQCHQSPVRTYLLGLPQREAPPGPTALSKRQMATLRTETTVCSSPHLHLQPF